MSETPDSAVRTYTEQHRAAFLDDLAEWLRIPSVSAQPEHDGDVRRSAEWLSAKLKETGFPVTEIWETPGAPAVFAEWPSEDPDAPTVLVYGHHDVQPAAREDGWATDPFEPVIRDGRMYGRGAADDKGQVFFHTLGVRAHLAATGRTTPAVHLKLLIEGEEESGSPNFRALAEKHADRLAADAVIVSDTGMWDEETPTVCTGMRGLAECEIELYGPAQDIHSGSFGGAVPNPATEIARLVAALHDEDGRVAIPGFYDGVTDLTDTERALFAELPFDEATWLRTAKSGAASGEAGYSTLERVWARPTAEVNGIGGGYQGAGEQDDHPLLRPGEDQLPAGRRPGPRPCTGGRPGVGRVPRPGGRPSPDRLPARHPPLSDPAGPPRPPGGGPRDGPGLRKEDPLHPGRRLGPRRRPQGRARRPRPLPRHLRTLRRLARPRREGRAGPAAQGRGDDRPPVGRAGHGTPLNAHHSAEHPDSAESSAHLHVPVHTRSTQGE